MIEERYVAMHYGSAFQPRDWSTVARNVANTDSNFSHASNYFIFTLLFWTFHFHYALSSFETDGMNYWFESAKMRSIVYRFRTAKSHSIACQSYTLYFGLTFVFKFTI